MSVSDCVAGDGIVEVFIALLVGKDKSNVFLILNLEECAKIFEIMSYELRITKLLVPRHFGCHPQNLNSSFIIIIHNSSFIPA